MKKIAIIGAGISGLFLANLLEKDKSYSYKIFEKKTSLDLNDGYGIQLSVNSINLLNKIGFQKINEKDVYFPKIYCLINIIKTQSKEKNQAGQISFSLNLNLFINKTPSAAVGYENNQT